MWISYYNEKGEFEGQINPIPDILRDGELITINGIQYYYDAITVRFKQIEIKG